ncbi:Spy/CpxP family protein refolding chaperone [Myxococcota bacterium]|nr:Spy/CpxP family protein refolding chaperone [Myxococcota bacterium]MBU1537516.1 Spy/CpxP family protein refolding chaperone [Myxococcota bacterium]
MTKQGWIAIILAIVFPSTALIIVLASRGSNEHRHPAHGPACRHDGPRHFPEWNKPPGHGPAVPFPRRPPLFSPTESPLKAMTRDLSLSPEQVKKIQKIETDTRKKEEELQGKIDTLEEKLHQLLKIDPVDRPGCLKIMEEMSRIRLSIDTIRIFRPLDIRGVFTPAQRSIFEKHMKIEPFKKRPGHGHFGPRPMQLLPPGSPMGFMQPGPPRMPGPPMQFMNPGPPMDTPPALDSMNGPGMRRRAP